MLVGHLAVGLTAKSVAPKVSLGTLVLAAMLADLLWAIFLVASIEHVEFLPLKGAANYLHASQISFSHSLVGDVIWAGLLAGAFFIVRRTREGSLILLGVVLSHWGLDWLSHRPDMPLVPAGKQYFGLGLWSSIQGTLLIEGGFWLGAIAIYVSVTDAKNRTGVFAFWSGVTLMTLVWYNNIAGEPPPNAHLAGVSSLLFFALIVGWAYWMDVLRPVRRAC